jgi:aldose 1-epimerase
MTQPLTLAHGDWRCEVVPALGGCLAGLWHQGLPVLRSPGAAAITSARQSACYVLVPYSNRVGHAELKWQGTSHPLVRNNGAEPHAIHGIGWQRPWAVLDHSADSVLLSHEHRREPGWPFAYDASQWIQLGDQGLTMSLSITNQDEVATPVGLGWHPFFVKHPGMGLQFEATQRWDMGDDQLPTRARPVSGLDSALDALNIDHCFSGWSGQAVLRGPGQRVWQLQSSLKHVVVFTRPDRDDVAVEPVSHVNNALNLLAQDPGLEPEDLGVTVLAPGESLSAHWSLSVVGAS